MRNLKQVLAKNYINARGWRTNVKIIVIESDDWGSVRMESKRAVEVLTGKLSNASISNFVRLDGLEKKQDLELLFDILYKFKDINGNNPVITALALTSNPNFELIQKSNYTYESESILDTYKKYSESDLIEFWIKEGIKNNIFYPQFHGKEHLHPDRYINAVRNKNSFERLAFLNNSIVGGGTETSREKNFLAAFEYHSNDDKLKIENRTIEGLSDFQNLFGFKSKSFCPSQSIYGDHIYDILKKNGVYSIQAGQQFEPINFKLKKINHMWGDRTKNGIIFWRRNCTFEPHESNQLDHVDNCLWEIETAFKWGKPAIINSHRINFTSRIDERLRDKTLSSLEKLLNQIIKKWPDVIFMNSASLTDFMIKNS